MTRRLPPVAGVAVAVALSLAALAACSDDDGDQAKVATTTPTTVATADTVTPDEQATTPDGQAAPSVDGGATLDSSRMDGTGGVTGGTGDPAASSPGGDTPVEDGQAPGDDATPRTGEACGSQVIVESEGYAEGRADAEQAHPFQVDSGPPPGPDDLDNDPITVGPADRYLAGYSQGWCDGGGAGAPDDSGGFTTN